MSKKTKTGMTLSIQKISSTHQFVKYNLLPDKLSTRLKKSWVGLYSPSRFIIVEKKLFVKHKITTNSWRWCTKPAKVKHVTQNMIEAILSISCTKIMSTNKQQGQEPAKSNKYRVIESNRKKIYSDFTSFIRHNIILTVTMPT